MRKNIRESTGRHQFPSFELSQLLITALHTWVVHYPQFAVLEHVLEMFPHTPWHVMNASLVKLASWYHSASCMMTLTGSLLDRRTTQVLRARVSVSRISLNDLIRNFLHGFVGESTSLLIS